MEVKLRIFIALGFLFIMLSWYFPTYASLNKSIIGMNLSDFNDEIELGGQRKFGRQRPMKPKKFKMTTR
jgi:hypothetical protein